MPSMMLCMRGEQRVGGKKSRGGHSLLARQASVVRRVLLGTEEELGGDDQVAPSQTELLDDTAAVVRVKRVRLHLIFKIELRTHNSRSDSPFEYASAVSNMLMPFS